MKDMKQVARELEQSGKSGAIRALADSPEGRSLGGMLDARAAEQAVKSGDTAALQQMLARVLATDEGRSLTDKLQKLLQER